MRASPPVLLVLNPRSGSADPERVVQAMRRRLGEVALVSPDDDGRLDAAVRAKIETLSPTLVVASGGDGTVSAVATAIAGLPIALGIVPSGTANLFAHELRIPLEIEAACEVIARGRRREVDTLEIAGRRCLCRIGWGIFAAVGRQTPQEAKQDLGTLAYLRSALPHLVEHEMLRIELEVDGHTVVTTGAGVMVTNISTIGLGELRWGDTVNPADGIADLFVLHASRLTEKLSVLWNTVVGRPDASMEVSHLPVRERVTVRTQPPSVVVADGEVLEPGERTAWVRAASLTVCVPEDARRPA